MKWWKLAAEHGFANAKYNLWVSYNLGQGVPQDYVLAHMWINIAAANTTDSEDQGQFSGFHLPVAAVSQLKLEELYEITDKTTSHLTKPLKRQVIGYSHPTGKATSDSTGLPKDVNQVAGYKQPAEELLAGHPKDGCQVVGYIQ